MASDGGRRALQQLPPAGLVRREENRKDFLVRGAGIDDVEGVIAVLFHAVAVIENHGRIVAPVVTGNGAQKPRDGRGARCAAEIGAGGGIAGEIRSGEAEFLDIPSGWRRRANVVFGLAGGENGRGLVRPDVERDEEEDFGGGQHEHDAEIW